MHNFLTVTNSKQSQETRRLNVRFKLDQLCPDGFAAWPGLLQGSGVVQGLVAVLVNRVRKVTVVANRFGRRVALFPLRVEVGRAVARVVAAFKRDPGRLKKMFCFNTCMNRVKRLGCRVGVKVRLKEKFCKII